MTDAPGGSQSSHPGLTARLRDTLDLLYREMLKFGLVGLLAFVVDAGVFNLLVYGHGDTSPLHHKPLTAKVISVSLSIVVAWLGNRFWTFRHRARPRIHHELLSFLAVNGVGMLIALACLGFSRYVLGFESKLADNISGTIIGTALGTLFRWWAYRKFIFLEVAQPETETESAIETATGAAAEPDAETGAEPDAEVTRAADPH